MGKNNGSMSMKRKRKMDPRLVSKQKWEIAYIARKFGVTVFMVRRVISQIGRSRRKVYAELR